jgi:hypothetical protein
VSGATVRGRWYGAGSGGSHDRTRAIDGPTEYRGGVSPATGTCGLRASWYGWYSRPVGWDARTVVSIPAGEYFGGVSPWAGIGAVVGRCGAWYS